MPEYSIIISEIIGPGLVRIEEDGTTYGIPFDEANADYQQYLINTNGGLPLPE